MFSQFCTYDIKIIDVFFGFHVSWYQHIMIFFILIDFSENQKKKKKKKKKKKNEVFVDRGPLK